MARSFAHVGALIALCISGATASPDGPQAAAGPALGLDSVSVKAPNRRQLNENTPANPPDMPPATPPASPPALPISPSAPPQIPPAAPLPHIPPLAPPTSSPTASPAASPTGSPTASPTTGSPTPVAVGSVDAEVVITVDSNADAVSMGTAGADANDQFIQSANDATTSDDVSCTGAALVSSGRRLETVDAATGRRQLSVSATFRLTYVFSAAFLAANGGNVETAINAAFDDIRTAITSGALQTALVNNLVGITVTVDQAASLVTLAATRVTALVPYTSTGDDSDDSLTDGEIAGIVVGSVAGAGLLGGGAFFAVTKMKGPKGGVAPDY